MICLFFCIDTIFSCKLSTDIFEWEESKRKGAGCGEGKRKKRIQCRKTVRHR